MKQYNAENMLVKPDGYPEGPGLLLSITPESAGWEYISFQIRKLAAGETWQFDTGDNELALVNLSGCYTVKSDKGIWTDIGGRRSPFEGAGTRIVSTPSYGIYRNSGRSAVSSP